LKLIEMMLYFLLVALTIKKLQGAKLFHQVLFEEIIANLY